MTLGWLASADVPAQVALAAGPDPKQFDKLVEDVERGDVVVTSTPEIRDIISRIDALRPKDDPPRELRLRAFRCDYDDLGPPSAGLAYARAGMADAVRAHDVGNQIRFGLCEASYIDGTGQMSQSLVPVEAALTLARRHNEPRLLAQALTHRGSLRSLRGEQAAALVDMLEAQRVYAHAGLDKEAESTLQDIAVAYRRMGDYDKAMDYLRQSIAFAEREGVWSSLTVSLLQTAFLHQDRGQQDEALAVLRRVLEISAEHSIDYDAAAAQLAMAQSLVKKGEFDQALLALSAARHGFDLKGDRSNDGMLHLVQGQLLAGQGDHATALTHYDESARAFSADTNLRYLVELYEARAQSHEALGNYRAAMDDLKLERTGRQKLNDDSRTQQSLLLQYQFDTARRDLQNAQLQADSRAQRQRLDAIERASHWQLAALISSALLLALLLGLLWRQLRRMRRINALALTDALTGVANRRHIEVASREAVAYARANNTPLAVLTFDLDWFKRINDSHGHAAGDLVLVRVTRACEAVLRQNDLLGRIGGEEFVTLLPNTPVEAATHVAERLRDAVAGLDLSDIAADLSVTISVGLAMLRPGDDGVHDVIDRADIALYRAKEGGRNRVDSEV
ncbi:diguanylate cyclase [Lysobacter fragariae]